MAEQADGQSRLVDLLNGVGDVYYRTDSQGLILEASDAVESLLGLSPENAIGTKLADYYVDAVKRDEFIRELAQSTGPVDTVSQLRHIKGDIVWVHTRAQMWLDDDGNPGGVEGLSRNISRQKELVEMLEKQEAKSTAILGAIQDGVYILQDDKFVFANDAFLKILGLSSAKHLPTDWRDLVHSDERQEIDKRNKLRRQGIDLPNTNEQHLVKSDGSIVDVLISVQWVENYPGGAAIVGTCKDMTDQHALEAQLRQSQKMEAVGQLTGGIAHDFNNLLAVVQGNISLLRDDLAADEPVDPEEARELIDEALVAIEKGASLNQRLLAFSRRQTLEPRIGSIANMLQGMEGLFERSLGESVGLRVITNKLSWLARVDHAQLEAAILNLVVNAKWAMPDGGNVLVECKGRKMSSADLRGYPQVAPGEYIEIAVHDNGIGMTRDTLEKVFDPFFTTREVGAGSGLGLSMVYGFAQQSGGWVDIRSELTIGTVVKLFIPRCSEEALPESERQHRLEGEGGNETILVVEDNGSVRRTTCKMLARLGYEVLQAEDGFEALEILDAQPDLDLVFSDIVMPRGMSGIDLVSKVRENHPGVKILLTSGYNDEKSLDEGMAVKILKKPFGAESLSAEIREALTSN